MTDQTDGPASGFAIVGVGAAACAACCAVPVFGFLSVLAAGAPIAALVVGGLLLAAVVAGLGAAFIGWRRRPASTRTTPPTPVTMQPRAGR